MKIYSHEPITEKQEQDIHNLLDISIKKLNIGFPVAITEITVTILRNSTVVLTIKTTCSMCHKHEIIKRGKKLMTKTYTIKNEFHSKREFQI